MDLERRTSKSLSWTFDMLQDGDIFMFVGDERKELCMKCQCSENYNSCLNCVELRTGNLCIVSNEALVAKIEGRFVYSD